MFLVGDQVLSLVPALFPAPRPNTFSPPNISSFHPHVIFLALTLDPSLNCSIAPTSLVFLPSDYLLHFILFHLLKMQLWSRNISATSGCRKVEDCLEGQY